MGLYKKIPKQFSQQNHRLMLLMVTQRVFFYLAALVLTTLLLASDTFLILKIAVASPLILIGSFSLHNVGLLGHEGTHFTLSNDRYQSALIGTLLSSMVPLHFNTGFALTHALHHWHTNTDKDPDLNLFFPLRNFWSRLFLARSKASRAYLKDTIALARGQLPHPNQVGLKNFQLFRLAKINLLSSALWLLVYAIFIVLYPASFGLAFATIYSSAVFLSGLRPYMEHVGTNSSHFRNSRTFTSPVLDCVFGTINYHLAHHMHPKVPAYKLPKLHRWMLKEGHIEIQQAVTSHSVLETLKQMNNGDYGPSHSR